MNEQLTGKIAVLILNWNGWRDTLKCLESVLESAEIEAKVLIVDNGSKDESASQIQQYISQLPETRRVEYLQLDRNFGFGGGCNRGLKHLLDQKFTWFVVLNNDLVLEPRALAEMLNVAKNEGAGLVGAKVFNEDGSQILFQGRMITRPWLLNREITQSEGDSTPTEHVEASCVLFGRDFLTSRLEKSGQIFDEDFFMYCEDTDLSLFAQSSGFTTLVALKAQVYHGLSVASGGAGNPRSFYYITRNRIYLAKRWLSPWQQILFHLYYFLSRPVRIVVALLKGNPKAARAILLGQIHGYVGICGPFGGV